MMVMMMDDGRWCDGCCCCVHRSPSRFSSIVDVRLLFALSMDRSRRRWWVISILILFYRCIPTISFQSSSISSIILHESGRRVYLGAAVSHFLVCKHKSICSYCIYSIGVSLEEGRLACIVVPTSAIAISWFWLQSTKSRGRLASSIGYQVVGEEPRPHTSLDDEGYHNIFLSRGSWLNQGLMFMKSEVNMTLIHIHLLTTTAQIDIIIYFYLGALGSTKA